MRDGTGGNRQVKTRAALGFCALALWILALTPPAQADPPAHGRATALDIEGLNHACGVAVDNKGDVYASSAGESKVKVYNPAHVELTSIANANEPCGLAVNTKGELFVSEKATGKVVRYKPNAYPFAGTPTYGSAEPIDSSGNAKGIAVDRADDRLYVAEGNHIAIYKADGSFEANVGTGNLTEATGVSAYTYINTGATPTNLKRHYYLTVADDAADQVKIFAAKEGSTLKLRRTIDGVDHDEDPETADQEFGFGAAGAHLAADPGNESRETRKCAQVQVEGNNQACTGGHFFLYDAANEAVDEFDATGEFVDQITNGAFADAGPTALAVDRSGTASDGTLYVSAGASAGAKLLAFTPLGMPARDPAPALSHALTAAVGVATDCKGNVYVAAEALIHVYAPTGVKLTSFTDAEGPEDVATDCEGNVYVVDTDPEEPVLTYYSPSKFPPDNTTTYTRHEPELIPGPFGGTGLKAVAVNPANDHVFVVGNSAFTPVVAEFSSVAEDSELIRECGTGLGLANARTDIDVYGATGEVYVSTNPQGIATLKCEEPAELLVRQIKGGGCPNGELGANPMLAVDQSNGHIVEYARNQTGASAREYDSSGACVAEFGTFASSSPLYKVAVDSSCALHDPPLTEQTTPTCAATYPSNGTAYVAVDGLDNGVQPNDVTAFGRLEYVCLGVCNSIEFELKVKKSGTGTGKVTSTPAGIDCGPDCDQLYEDGTKVTLTATPEGDSTFKGWSGSGCSGTGTCEVTMSAAKAVTAEFTAAAKPKFKLKVKKAGSGTGTVTSAPAGINCGLDCEEEYEEGTAVTLTGAAGANTKPVAWSNCDSVNGENKCLVTMSGAKEVTATFALEQHLLSVSKTGSGTGKVTSSPAGIDCGSDCSELYDHGTPVTLSATPDAGSEFTGFSGACTGTGTCEVTMSAAKAVTATFDEEEAPPGGITLTVDVEGTGSGTVTSDKGTISCDPFCSDEYAAGTVVVLTATPSPGSVFMSWRYCDKGGVNGRQCTMTVDKAKTVKATFTTTHALEVSKAPGSGMGKVQSSPGGILCLFNCSATTASFKEGTQVTLKQTPAKHFHFTEWLGDCTGSGACELTMGQDHEVQAKFAEDLKHLLTLTKSGGGQGTVKSSLAGINCGVTCSQMASAYYQGEVLELTATPGKGSVFGGWSGGGCSGTGTCTVTMSAAKSVEAEFE